ncbi:MAG: hypothetical protein Q9226_008461, partial [Calogaya cf. arnoldii]
MPPTTPSIAELPPPSVHATTALPHQAHAEQRSTSSPENRATITQPSKSCSESMTPESAAPRGGFPLDRLAPELQHMIFAAADTGDVPNLRLTCKSLGAIGLEYLLPEVELLFTPKSFDRLRGISEHPTLGRHVKSLVYRVDSLKICANILEWYQQIPQMTYLRFCLGPSARAWLHKKWIQFQQIWEQQERIRQKDFGGADIVTMMANLPALEHVAVSNYYDVTQSSAEGTYPQSRTYKAYEDVLGNPVGELFYDHPTAVPQLLSVLRALDHSKLALKSLCFGLADWHLFADNEFIDLAKKTLSSLTSLKMRMALNVRDKGHYLRLCTRGQLLAFLRSLPSLQRLDFLCDSFGDSGKLAKFRTIFGTAVWTHLHTISLHDLKVSQHDLNHFFKRHVKTLKVVHLALTKLRGGSWPKLWVSIRDSLDLIDLTLEDIWYEGVLLGSLPG